jgi:hypothetical protein
VSRTALAAGMGLQNNRKKSAASAQWHFDYLKGAARVVGIRLKSQETHTRG